MIMENSQLNETIQETILMIMENYNFWVWIKIINLMRLLNIQYYCLWKNINFWVWMKIINLMRQFKRQYY